MSETAARRGDLSRRTALTRVAAGLGVVGVAAAGRKRVPDSQAGAAGSAP